MFKVKERKLRLFTIVSLIIIFIISCSAVQSTEKPISCPSLFDAIDAGDPQAIDMMLKNGADPHFIDQNREKHTPFLYSVKIGDPVLLDIFIKNGISVDYIQHYDWWELTALLYATRIGQTKIVDYLLKNEADPDLIIEDGIRNRTALSYACQLKFVEIVELLLKYGANVNAKDNSGVTPLHLACSSLNELDFKIESGLRCEIIQILINHDAQINPTTNSLSPLAIATQFKDTEAMILLVHNGADVNATDGVGNSILSYALSIHNLDIVKFLHSKGANINYISEEKKISLLMKASFISILSIVKYLVENGADVHLKDYMGKTALDYAYEYYKIASKLYSTDPSIAEEAAKIIAYLTPFYMKNEK